MTDLTMPVNAINSEHGTQTRIIKDSISEDGHRLTTFEVRLWRSMLAELNTHRVFSRNSASSRAIPFPKQVARVHADPARPLLWAAEQPGMQGGAEIEQVHLAELAWERARDNAATVAQDLADLGVHKSICNRLIEPFMWHTVVITASSYQNFFGLRVNPGAQPEIRIAAEQMKTLFDASTPTKLGFGEWHLPYIGAEESKQATAFLYGAGEAVDSRSTTYVLVRMSSARCAATSYMRHAEWRDVAKDLGLYEKLTTATPMHASPLEHVATPNPENVHTVTVSSFADPTEQRLLDLTLPKYGNLVGWHQHRFDVEIARGYQAYS